jgi:hypothetical protein
VDSCPIGAVYGGDLTGPNPTDRAKRGSKRQFRRLRVRSEKRTDIHEAFLSLVCALICWQSVRTTCAMG